MIIDNRFDLTDCTFVIPYKKENQSREDNLVLLLKYLGYHFKTNIIVAEQSDTIVSAWKDRIYEYFDHNQHLCENFKIHPHTYLHKSEHFHKTKLLNIGCSLAETPILVSQDVDIIFYPSAYIEAYGVLHSDSADFVFPFNRGIVNIERQYHEQLNETLNLNDSVPKHLTTLAEELFYNKELKAPESGCLFMKRNSFWEIGGENERFFNYNLEDAERFFRMNTLGKKVMRCNNMIYHLNHDKGEMSTWTNPLYFHGESLFKRVSEMNKEQLQEYIKNEFTWLNLYNTK